MRVPNHRNSRGIHPRAHVLGSHHRRVVVLRISRTKGEAIEVTADDAVVVGVGAAAATYDWWGWIIQAVPETIQVIVTVATLVYVVFRAANEIRKFLAREKE